MRILEKVALSRIWYNTLVINTPVAITGLTTGTRICVSPADTNPGTSTLNFSGNGAVPILCPLLAGGSANWPAAAATIA
ncbi:MAG: hypothetical protein ACREE1_08530 [Stellaceae bacterium]